MPEDLKQQLRSHLEATRTCMAPINSKWSTYVRLYKAIRAQEVKRFPWVGAANIFMPELHTEVNTIAANIYGSTIRQDPPFLVRSLKPEPEYRERAVRLEQFLTFYTRKVQMLDSYWRRSLPYLILLGTHVAKLQFMGSGKLGFPEVRVSSVPLHHMYAYPGIRDPELSPFIADLAWVPLSKLYLWMKSGRITKQTFERLRLQAVLSATKDDRGSEHRIPSFSLPGDAIPIYDCYMTYYNPSTGEPSRRRVVYEELTDTVLWEEPWTDPLPYVFVYYKQDEDSLFGLGLGDLLWTLQDAINTAYNQAIDNATIANTRMVVAPPGSNIEPNDPVFPGRVIISPASDKVRPWPMGDIYPSALTIPSIVRTAMERVAATPESLMGMADSVAKTRATFAGAALNVQMGVTRIDMASAEFEQGLVELVWRTLELLSRYAAGDLMEFPVAPAPYLPSGEPPVLTETLVMSQELSSRSIYEIQPSRRTANQQIERQASILLSNLVSQYLERVLQFGVMVTQNPAVLPLVQELWTSANEAMKRVLRSFNVEDPERIIVELSEALPNAQPQGLNASGLGALSGEAEPGAPPPTNPSTALGALVASGPVPGAAGAPPPGEELP